MRKGECKFYNGIQNECCNAGIIYNNVIPEPNEQLGVAYRLPCIDLSLRGKMNQVQSENYARRGTCEKYAEPTAEDIQQDNIEIEKLLNNFTNSFNPIIKRIKKEHKGKDWRGVEECPICQGKLHLTHAAYNGHVHGKCETDKCLSWME
jgi:hypothetical protein